jgi:hypothetical protein
VFSESDHVFKLGRNVGPVAEVDTVDGVAAGSASECLGRNWARLPPVLEALQLHLRDVTLIGREAAATKSRDRRHH